MLAKKVHMIYFKINFTSKNITKTLEQNDGPWPTISLQATLFVIDL